MLNLQEFLIYKHLKNDRPIKKRKVLFDKKERYMKMKDSRRW